RTRIDAAVHTSGFSLLGSCSGWFEVRSSRFQVRGSKFQVRCSMFEVRGDSMRSGLLAVGFVVLVAAALLAQAPAQSTYTPAHLQAPRDPGYAALIATCKTPPPAAPARGGAPGGGRPGGAPGEAGAAGAAGAAGRAGASGAS